MFHQIMADLVLILHFFYVLGVVVPVPLIMIGGLRGWSFVRNAWFRRIHLAMVLAVAIQVPFQILCPLTVWEQRLRDRSGETGPGESFLAHWVGRFLYYDFPPWVFSTLYVAFGLLVVLFYFKIPPRKSPSLASRADLD